MSEEINRTLPSNPMSLDDMIKAADIYVLPCSVKVGNTIIAAGCKVGTVLRSIQVHAQAVKVTAYISDQSERLANEMDAAAKNLATEHPYYAQLLQTAANGFRAADETYARRPIDCKHERASIKCPDCGIDFSGTLRHAQETPVRPGSMPVQHPAPCWCPYCGEPHSPAVRETRDAEKANERELSPSEAASFDKALARSPRRVPHTTEDDFAHWLSYSGKGKRATAEQLRDWGEAYFAGAEPRPVTDDHVIDPAQADHDLIEALHQWKATPIRDADVDMDLMLALQRYLVAYVTEELSIAGRHAYPTDSGVASETSHQEHAVDGAGDRGASVDHDVPGQLKASVSIQPPVCIWRGGCNNPEVCRSNNRCVPGGIEGKS